MLDRGVKLLIAFNAFGLYIYSLLIRVVMACCSIKCIRVVLSPWQCCLHSFTWELYQVVDLFQFFRIEFYRIYRICRKLFLVVTARKWSCGKTMFLHLSVILFTRGWDIYAGETAIVVGSMHPTGMHSCRGKQFVLRFVKLCIRRTKISICLKLFVSKTV